jgi:exonuclease SbcC
MEKLTTDILILDSDISKSQDSINEATKAEDSLKHAQKAQYLEEAALDSARSSMNMVVSELARAEAEIELAKEASSKIEFLSVVLEKYDFNRRCYALLSKAFGKTGIQSLEIDAAGPAVSDIANDLLLSCFGPRFSIRFLTQVLKDDKSGYKDAFDIYVTDSSGGGREGSIDDLSGGERVIVCEAVSLAICLFNTSLGRSGWVSLWRDEASSAIDDSRAPLYIRMLRRAREQGHFKRLFFIAHQSRVTEQADAQVKIDGGKFLLE